MSVALFIHVFHHQTNERRPDQRLEEAVEEPEHRHQLDGGQQHHAQVDQRGCKQAERNDFARRELVADHAAQNLADAVGDKRAGDGDACQLLGDLQVNHDLCKACGVIDSRHIGCEVNKAAQPFQLAHLSHGTNLPDTVDIHKTGIHHTTESSGCPVGTCDMHRDIFEYNSVYVKKKGFASAD